MGITWRREICQDHLPEVGRRSIWPGRVGIFSGTLPHPRGGSSARVYLAPGIRSGGAPLPSPGGWSRGPVRRCLIVTFNTPFSDKKREERNKNVAPSLFNISQRYISIYLTDFLPPLIPCNIAIYRRGLCTQVRSFCTQVRSKSCFSALRYVVSALRYVAIK